mmetsp:Transcript_22372/g.51515  ORF Transcript_22372/g.51515 Transcript_22372/m.51515 type:complete len:224 (-) Transcript_22372:1434-2105(-)
MLHCADHVLRSVTAPGGVLCADRFRDLVDAGDGHERNTDDPRRARRVALTPVAVADEAHAHLSDCKLLLERSDQRANVRLALVDPRAHRTGQVEHETDVHHLLAARGHRPQARAWHELARGGVHCLTQPVHEQEPHATRLERGGCRGKLGRLRSGREGRAEDEHVARAALRHLEHPRASLQQPRAATTEDGAVGERLCRTRHKEFERRRGHSHSGLGLRSARL